MKSVRWLVMWALVVSQLFNNPASGVLPYITVGEAAIASFILYSLSVGIRTKLVIRGAYGRTLAWAVFVYMCGAVIGCIAAPDPGAAMRHLITVGAQCSLTWTVLATWKKSFDSACRAGFMAAALVAAGLNCLNAVYPEAEVLLGRSNVGGFGVVGEVSARRYVSVTTIYGQFGFFVVFGGFVFLDWVIESKARQALKVVVGVCGGSVLLFGLIFSGSRNSLVAVVVASSVFLMARGRVGVRIFFAIWLIGLVSTFGPRLAESLIAIREETVENRLFYVQEAFWVIREWPTGLGYRGFQSVTGSPVVLHNSYLDAFVCGGLAGGVAFGVIVALPVIGMLFGSRGSRLGFRGELSGWIGGMSLLMFYNGLSEYQYFLIAAWICSVVDCLGERASGTGSG